VDEIRPGTWRRRVATSRGGSRRCRWRGRKRARPIVARARRGARRWWWGWWWRSACSPRAWCSSSWSSSTAPTARAWPLSCFPRHAPALQPPLRAMVPQRRPRLPALPVATGAQLGHPARHAPRQPQTSGVRLTFLMTFACTQLDHIG